MLHQVASGQILVSGEYAVGVLARNSHKLGKSCAGTDEYGLIAFLIHQLVYGHGFTDDNIGLNLNAQFLTLSISGCTTPDFGRRNSGIPYVSTPPGS